MEQDKIGRKDIVDKICGLVDSLQKNKNFCLALNGAWGSGKSFVMEMIEERLKKQEEYIIVKYDAWKNNFYPDPLIAILSCVMDGIQEKLYLVERHEQKAKNIAKTSIRTLSKLSTKIEKLKKVGEGIKDIIKTFQNPVDMSLTGDFKSYQTLLDDVKEVLNELTQKEEYRHRQTKLIILVDEIDRCLPDEQLKVLERLHHLFDVKNCAVIVAMNQSCVAKTVQTIYGMDGYEYLRKFFNFTFKLEISASSYLKNLYNEFTKKFETIETPDVHQEVAINLAYECLLYGEKNVLNRVDNRELTRYYEGVVNICNDFGWEKLIDDYIFFILIGLYIRKMISSDFLNENELVQNQNAVNDRNKYYSSKEKIDTMPYCDYLEYFLGIDRTNPPKISNQLSGINWNHLPEFSWTFNEMAYYSLRKQFHDNHISCSYGQPSVSPEICKELAKLIILYGGEQEKCEK